MRMICGTLRTDAPAKTAYPCISNARLTDAAGIEHNLHFGADSYTSIGSPMGHWQREHGSPSQLPTAVSLLMPQDLHASNTELRAFPFLAALAVMLSCPHTQQTVRAELLNPCLPSGVVVFCGQAYVVLQEQVHGAGKTAFPERKALWS